MYAILVFSVSFESTVAILAQVWRHARADLGAAARSARKRSARAHLQDRELRRPSRRGGRVRGVLGLASSRALGRRAVARRDQRVRREGDLAFV